MKLIQLVRRFILKIVLKNAFTFEIDAQKIYKELQAKSKNSAAEQEFKLLIEEEEKHRNVLENLIACHPSHCDFDKYLKDISNFSFHNLEKIKPLSPELKEKIGIDIKRAIIEEEKSMLFYANLSKMSKIKASKDAFRILADMEAQHLLILKKLISD